ncbi:MAG: hypothetical protein K8R92_09260 [Planctomycetes bacterium]|nr:hypothetical protein [Planctomycetota bacterium]
MANARALTFSEAYGLTLDGSEEWFDPCIVLDSPLCIDPFLMLDLEQEDEFKGAHVEVVEFFQRQYHRVAKAGTDISSSSIQTVIQAMHMPEAGELCLGYSEGTEGAGTGAGLARLMVQAIMASIALGLKDIKHFEEISILGGSIGPDRISDATAGISKWRFALYTARICAELKIPMEKRPLDRARYDLAQDRWVAVDAVVPLNPRTGKPLLLTPQRFLRHLPTLGSTEFNKYAERQWREHHREELSRKLVTFDKVKVLEAARKDEKTRGEFMKMAAQIGGKPYDFKRDRMGVTMQKAAFDHLSTHPFQFTPPTTGAEMKRFVLALANYFKHFIEQQKGWELLWDGTQQKGEKAVQRLMFGLVFLICAKNNVSVDPETNAGRGPVDFKFSYGFNAKCLLEAKLANNTKWIRGVTQQLPTYIVADVGKYGVYLLVAYDDSQNRNISQLKFAASSVASRGIEIDVVVVDASRNKPSASKL